MKNESFFVVTSTIIPVYLLALTLQSSFYDKLARYIAGDVQSHYARTSNSMPDSTSKPAKKAYAIRDLLIGLFAGLVVLAVVWSTIGEVVALLVLYAGKTTHFADTIVLSAVVILTVATLLVIAGRILGPPYAFGILSIIMFLKSTLKKKANNKTETQTPNNNGSLISSTYPNVRNSQPDHETDT